MNLRIKLKRLPEIIVFQGGLEKHANKDWRGKRMVYVVVEGIDGCGKTSLCNRLQDSGMDVVFTREPYDQSIKDLKGLDPVELAYKFAEDRYMHMRDVVIPALKSDKHIISDRSYISNLVYQGRTKNIEKWVMSIQPCNLTAPDSIIFLTCDPNIAAQRSGETPEILEDIQNRYVRRFEPRGFEGQYITTIDTSHISEYEVFERAMNLIERSDVALKELYNASNNKTHGC